MASFSRARYSKWPPPPSQKTRNKKLLAIMSSKDKKVSFFTKFGILNPLGPLL